jgi:chemotaxis signal transduction protein
MKTLVFFRAGDGRYAVPVESTLGVRPATGLVPLPRPAEGVVGLLPGNPPLSVVSLVNDRHESGRASGGAAGHILLLTAGEQRAGLLVDAVTRVARVPASNIGGPPAGQALELVAGLLEVDGDLVMLADVAALISGVGP